MSESESDEADVPGPDAAHARLKAEAARLRAKVAEDTPEARLIANAASFLRSGGSVSWDRWESMGPATRRAFDLAAHLVQAQFVDRLAEEIVGRLAREATPAPAQVDEAAALRSAGHMALNEVAGRGAT